MTSTSGSRKNTRPRLALETQLMRDDIANEVVPGLFIGSIYASLNEDGLRQCGITHILNASRCPSTFPNAFTYLAIDIRDNGEANLISCIPVSNIFIESGMDHGGVLVHCYGGRSRSAALIAAFLMSSMNATYEQVIPMILRARPMTAINSGFQRSLKAYGASGCDVYRAQQILLKQRIQEFKKYREQNLAKRITLEGESKGCERFKRDRSPRPDSGGSNCYRKYNEDGTISNDGGDSMDVDVREAATNILKGMNNNITTNNNHNSKTLADGSNDDSAIVIAPPPHPSNLLSMRSPPLRLSRPSSSSIRVIPPLRGLDRAYCCSWPGCGEKLFRLVNVIRTDLLDDNGDIIIEKNTNTTTTEESTSSMIIDDFAESKCRSNNLTDREAMEKRLVQMDIEDGVYPDDGSTSTSMTGTTSDNDSPHNSLMSPTMGISMHNLPPVTSRARGAKSFSFESVNENSLSTNTSNNLNHQSSDDSSNSNSNNDSKGENKDDEKMTSDNTSSNTSSNNNPRDNDGFRVPGVPLGMKVTLPHSITAAQSKLSAFESPRIPVPPSGYSGISNINTQHVPTLATHQMNGRVWSPGNNTRPQSAERRRWMARISLLRGSGKETKAEAKMLEVMQGDEAAVTGGLGNNKYVHLEWLPWMGDNIPSGAYDEGDISCPGCQRVLGSWAWNPHPRHTQNGRLETPIIRVVRSVVCESGLELDATPLTTPREDTTPRSRPNSSNRITTPPANNINRDKQAKDIAESK